MRKCDYSSFLTYSGPEAVRTELVDAANKNKLCDLLPTCVREAASADMRLQLYRHAVAALRYGSSFTATAQRCTTLWQEWYSNRPAACTSKHIPVPASYL